MNKYFISDTHFAVARKRKSIILTDGETLENVIKQWAKENKVKEVFVYDEGLRFIWSYNF